MTDDQIERIYKEGMTLSHAAALRAVYQAGYAEGMVPIAVTETVSEPFTEEEQAQARSEGVPTWPTDK